MERLMRKLAVLAVLAGSLSLVGGLSAEAVCSSARSTVESQHTYTEHLCFEYYFNNSGAALSSGNVVVFDLTGTGVNIPNLSIVGASRSASAIDLDGTDGDVTNIGSYITTTTNADADSVAGVVDDDSCADQSYCRVQTAGARGVICEDATDAVTTEAAVGTTATAGSCGGGNGLGFALEAGSGFDSDVIWINIHLGNDAS